MAEYQPLPDTDFDPTTEQGRADLDQTVDDEFEDLEKREDESQEGWFKRMVRSDMNMKTAWHYDKHDIEMKESYSAEKEAMPCKSACIVTKFLNKTVKKVWASTTLAADMRTLDTDIAIISETHLNNKIPDCVVGIEGYSIHRRDRDWERRRCYLSDG
ncbi:hypothetical protein AC249_AIPGENE15299 [Exaiptasia diaphana]|nr:hypothetical protein AC249_AIPGENE15299 [Exaiptasia diaphana]